MSLPASVASPARLEIHDERASSVIVHRVAPEHTGAFLDWERGIGQAAERFAGYRGTDIYPPTAGGPPDWVVIVHFDDPENLGRWIDSPARAEWTTKLPAGIRDFRLKTLPTGFGSWFASQLEDRGRPPAPWKMALTVLVGLYPTVMLLNLLVGPHLSWLGVAASMLVGNALSVSILQWGLMPPLQRLLRPWLNAGEDAGRGRSTAWLALILVVLVGLVALFQRIGG